MLYSIEHITAKITGILLTFNRDAKQLFLVCDVRHNSASTD